MRRLLNFVAQEILYITDSFFKVTVDQKRGPNDAVGSKEMVLAVLDNLDNGSKRIVRRKR